MRPSVEFQIMLSMDSETSDLSTGKSEERCPEGQVPIHRPQINYTNDFIHPKKIITEANLHVCILTIVRFFFLFFFAVSFIK